MSLEDYVNPLANIFVPIFFVLMGIQVKLETFFDLSVIQLALALTVVAILGKVVTGWFSFDKKLNRMAIGIGMIPRGEVGLIFASIGKSLGVVNDSVFSAVVIMVIVTTLITPYYLNKTFK